MPRRATGTGGGARGALAKRGGAWGVEIEGLPEVSHNLADVMPREARNIARRVVVRVARDVRDEMRKKAPVGDGTLKKAIRHKRERAQPGQAEAAVWITHGRGEKHDAWYWHFVEWGTVKSAAKPFITPTVEAMRPKLPGLYQTHFGRELEKEMAKRARRQG